MSLQSTLSPLSQELDVVKSINQLAKRLRLLVFVSALLFLLLTVTFVLHLILPEHEIALSLVTTGVLVILNAISVGATTLTIFRVIQLQKQSYVRLIETMDDVDRRSQQMTTAAMVARDATMATSLEALLDRTAQLIAERFGFYHTGIFLIDANEEYAQLKAASGPASQQLLQKAHRLKVGEEGIVGYVTETGKARIAADVDLDNRHYPNPALAKTRSEIAIPFKVYDKVIGALDVQSEEENAFTETDIEILQSMADLLAIAIARTQLNEEVQQYADLLEQHVDDRTRELVKAQAQVRAVMDSMGEGVIYSQQGQTRFINKALIDMFGLPEETDLQTFPFVSWQIERNPDFQMEQESINRYVREQGIWRGECMLMRQDGTLFDAGLTVSSVHATGNETGSVMLIRDISQEKALQAQKNRFVANASHELRTPITNLITRLYLLKRQPERAEEHIRILEHVAKRMRYLVEHLLDMARFERGKIKLQRKRVNLLELIDAVVKVQEAEAENKQIELSIDLPDGPIAAHVDEGRLEQVLTNLLTNALNYTPEGGTIVVSLTADTKDVHLAVKDTGIGIAPEHIPNLFQPFYRVNDGKSDGTGLGLSITKTIVELHGGTVSVESVLNEGTTFTVTLKQSPVKV